VEDAGSADLEENIKKRRSKMMMRKELFEVLGASHILDVWGC
jgi:hypothetical protein